MTAVGPGTPLVCVVGGVCDCGHHKVTEQAIYTCEDVGTVPFHGLWCKVTGCDGFHLVMVRGKEHPFCMARFKPLNDGDTSKVTDEEPLNYEEQLGDAVNDKKRERPKVTVL